MARTNKYASLNFNDIYEKKSNTKSSSSSSSIAAANNKTIISNSRIHGNMLVLTRPTPKPIQHPSPPPPSHQPPPTTPDPIQFESDSISLRPLGRTGSALTIPINTKDRDSSPLSVSPKPNKFVPPHLRPGFAGRQEKPAQLSQFRDNGRPKSGGGYEMHRGGGESDLIEANRIRVGSGVTRPSSSGLWTNVHYNPVPTPYYHPVPPVYQFQCPTVYTIVPGLHTHHAVETALIQNQYPNYTVDTFLFFYDQYTSDPVDTSSFHNLDETAVIDDLDDSIFYSDIVDGEYLQEQELLEQQQNDRRERVREHLNTRIQQQDSDDDICVICQEEYRAQEIIGKMKCCHEFHNSCIEEWLFQKDTCPMCKANFY